MQPKNFVAPAKPEGRRGDAPRLRAGLSMDLYEQEGIMTTTVTVTLNSDGNLTLDRPAVDLNSGDTLEWDFQNVPSDCVPGILFDSPFGPFQALQVLGKNVVQGKGNLGTDGESYTYRAQLLDLNGIR